MNIFAELIHSVYDFKSYPGYRRSGGGKAFLYGLLLTLLTDAGGQLPGNLVLDTNEWEKHLDIMSSLRYNTMIM